METKGCYLINLLIVSIFLFPITSLSQVKDKYHTKSILIDIGKLKTTYLDKINSGLNKNEFPIINQFAANRFIELIYNNNLDSFKMGDPINLYLHEYYLGKNNDRPIVLIMHPIDIQELIGDVNKTGIAKDAYMKACVKSKTINLLIDSLSKEKEKIFPELKEEEPCDLVQKIDPKAIAKALSEINQSINLLQTELTKYDGVLKSAEDDLIKYSSKLSENTDKTLTYILNKEDDEWNDYLLNKSQMLFVIVGGKNDLSNATLKIDNLPSSFQTSFNEFKNLATQLGVFDTASDTKSCCSAPEIKNSISIKFVFIKKNEIKAPSIITLTEEKSKLNLKFENHEKARFGIKIGVSASKFDRKLFSLDPQNNLTIKPDSLQQNEWKGSLMVLLDWYPAGRDIDRLEPIWKSNKDKDFFDVNRLAVTAGLKLSKDPLESSFLGLSYALSREFSLTGGLAFNATPKDVQNLPVGVNATLDYLKSNADRKLEPSWYFGFTLTPGSMSKVLNLNK